jgi:hypothetical protein
MAFENIDELPLGKLIQPSQESPKKLGKKRKKKLRLKKIREQGYSK